ncbi:MAG: efflux transporter periplasmic adaptor subunit [Robiginitomaculum sp.]|nr:MAG: efflux transporter periplasmic adaptor subunit [Robiginitomaculum sp.]
MLVLAAIVVSAPLAFAHGEQINVGNNRASGPVSLTSAQIKALGLQTEMADMRPIARLLGVNGAVATLPDAQANVSLRISGNVNAVYVNLGDAVRKGQKLALVMARAVGNPPPTVAARAPIDGIIDARNIIVGQSVGPDTALFHLSNRRRMLVIGNVYEEDLGLVKVGQAAKVSLLAYPDKTFSGTVSFIGTMLDPDTRTVALWVLLDNPDNLLKPNLFARADIVLGQKEAALTVANAAVLEANGDKFVFIRDGDNYDRIEVGTGTEDSQYTEITSGLVPGDEVVTQGAREIYTLWLTGGKLEAEE